MTANTRVPVLCLGHQTQGRNTIGNFAAAGSPKGGIRALTAVIYSVRNASVFCA
jgi:hypothetical protein